MRDGQINEYALHFVVPVPAHVKDLAFTWQSLAGRPVSKDVYGRIYIDDRFLYANLLGIVEQES